VCEVSCISYDRLRWWAVHRYQSKDTLFNVEQVIAVLAQFTMSYVLRV